MMTWGKFKELVEAGNDAVTDDTPLAYVDVQGFELSDRVGFEVVVERLEDGGKRMYVRN